MHRSPFLRALAAGVALTVLAACGGDSGSSGSPAAAPESSLGPEPAATTPGDTASGDTASGDTSPASPPDAAAPDALQFTAPLVGGGSLDFTQYAGRTVALWFWAPT